MSPAVSLKAIHFKYRHLLIAAFTALLFTVSAYAQSPASPTTSGKISGNFNCQISNKEGGTSEGLRVVFEVSNGVVKNFSTSWAQSSDSPDLRPGYATTSQMDMNDLQQVQSSETIVLKIKPGRHEKYQENCRVWIQENQSSILVSSSECSSPSLALNIVIDKKTGACHKSK